MPDAHISHPVLKARPSLSSCRGLASSPRSPVCWGSVTCLHWETGTDGALGTPVGLGPSLLGVAAGDVRREKMLSLFRSSPLSAPGAVGVRLVAYER